MVRRTARLVTSVSKQIVQQVVIRPRKERARERASVDKAPWVISTADQPPTLEIVLLRQTVIISWNQFVYAEGGADEVRIAFASHDVAVKGAGLTPAASNRRQSGGADSRKRAVGALSRLGRAFHS